MMVGNASKANGCLTFWNNPGIFEKVRQSLSRALKARIDNNGEHFEHLLWSKSAEKVTEE